MRIPLPLCLFILVGASGKLKAQTDSYTKLEVKFDQLYNAKAYGEALQVAREMKAWAGWNEGDTGIRLAVSMMEMGNCFVHLKQNDSALHYWDICLAILARQNRAMTREAAQCHQGKAGVYFSERKTVLAISHGKQALEINKNKLGPEHLEVANCMNDLGVYYRLIGDFAAAEPLYKQSLDIRIKALGKDHPDVALSLNNLASLHSNRGDFNTAEDLYRQSLEIRIKTLGHDHPDVAATLNNLGVVSKLLGKYKEAESFYQQALTVKKAALGDQHPAVAMSLSNLGILYKTLGDFNAAEPLYLEAVQIYTDAHGESHPDVATSLSNLGVLYEAMGKFNSADSILSRVLDIRLNHYGQDHPEIATSLNNLGLVKKSAGDYHAAETHYLKALGIRKKILGADHPLVATSLNNLSILYLIQQRYTEAEAHLLPALEIRKRTLGPEHPEYISTSSVFAYLLSKTNREAEAYALFQNNFNIKAREIADNFEWLSENQKEAYWQKESELYMHISAFAEAAVSKIPDAAGLNYNAALISKSKLLETTVSKENYYREVDELREELGYRRRLIAKMESEGVTEKTKLQKLRREADSLDKRLTLSWPDYARQKKNLSIGWKQVQENLVNGEAAIEFIRFENRDDSQVHYNALLLKKGDSNPRLVKLCTEKDLLAIPPETGFSKLFPLVWQPLDSLLNDVKTIYYAPVGALYAVPFHALHASEGRSMKAEPVKADKRGGAVQQQRAMFETNAEYLMDRYTLHQLTSTRYLAMGLKQQVKDPVSKTITIVGGVDYDFLPGVKTPIKKEKKKKTAETYRSSASASGKLNYLEGTKTEADEIHLRVTAAGWQAGKLEYNQATEENIIRFEGKEARGILHLATHGFAFPEYDFQDSSISKKTLRYSYRYSHNPMVRSGLILAGGNWAWTGSDTLTRLGAEQNGILSALEVSQLNLKKTKLVVLSACETGLGKTEGAEGNFGLKRGFKLAGVEQIIVSLWSVPDKETMELMTYFYSDLAITLNPVSSFEKAQKTMRRLYPTHPENWAGFVLVR